MDMDPYNGKMGIFMKEIFSKTKFMEKEKCTFMMVIFIVVKLATILYKDMDLLYVIINTHIKVTFLTTNFMGKVKLFLIMDLRTREFSITVFLKSQTTYNWLAFLIRIYQYRTHSKYFISKNLLIFLEHMQYFSLYKILMDKTVIS